MSGRYPIGPDGKLLRPKDAALPEAPYKPENMRFNTQEGAEAFSQYIVDTIEYMWLSGDTRTFDELADPDCEWCQDIRNATKSRVERGGWLLDISLELVDSTIPRYHPAPKDLWNSVITVRRSDAITYNGESLNTHNGELMRLLIVARHVNDDWKLIAAGAAEQ